MKPFFYGVRDCDTQDVYLLNSRVDDYEYGDIVVVCGRRVRVITPAVSQETVSNDKRLILLPVLPVKEGC